MIKKFDGTPVKLIDVLQGKNVEQFKNIIKLMKFEQKRKELTAKALKKVYRMFNTDLLKYLKIRRRWSRLKLKSRSKIKVKGRYKIKRKDIFNKFGQKRKTLTIKMVKTSPNLTWAMYDDLREQTEEMYYWVSYSTRLQISRMLKMRKVRQLSTQFRRYKKYKNDFSVNFGSGTASKNFVKPVVLPALVDDSWKTKKDREEKKILYRKTISWKLKFAKRFIKYFITWRINFFKNKYLEIFEFLKNSKFQLLFFKNNFKLYFKFYLFNYLAYVNNILCNMKFGRFNIMNYFSIVEFKRLLKLWMNHWLKLKTFFDSTQEHKYYLMNFNRKVRKHRFIRRKNKTCYLKLRLVTNNFFITITDLDHKVLLSRSSGMSNDTRNKKKKISPNAVHFSMRFVRKVLRKWDIRNIILFANSRITRHMRNVVQSIKVDKRLCLKKMYFNKSIPHHRGNKKQKIRRL